MHQSTDAFGSLLALNPGASIGEVHCILKIILMLHHECMLVVHWNFSRVYKRKRNGVPSVHAIVRRALWRIDFHRSRRGLRQPNVVGALAHTLGLNLDMTSFTLVVY